MKPIPIANLHLSRDYLLESYHFIDQYAYLRTRRLKPPTVFKICAILMLLNAILSKFKTTWTTLQSLTGYVRLIKRASPCIIRRITATKQNKNQIPRRHHIHQTSTNTYPTEAKQNTNLLPTSTPHKPTQQSQTPATHQWNDIVDKWDPPLHEVFPVPALKQLAQTALQAKPASILSISRQQNYSRNIIQPIPNKMQITNMNASKQQAWAALLESHLRSPKDRRRRKKKSIQPHPNKTSSCIQTIR